MQGSLKWVDNFGIQILIYVMLGWGLNIVVGLAGLLDLGYVAFYAVGAYSYALLATDLRLVVLDLLLPAAGILAAFWGVLLGFPVLRLRGDYLAHRHAGLRRDHPPGADQLGRASPAARPASPASRRPPSSACSLQRQRRPTSFAARSSACAQSGVYYTIFLYYLILVPGAAHRLSSRIRLRRMPVGRAWEALREDEIACRSLGINTTNTKLTAFAIGAMFGGFAGSFFAARQGFITPESFIFLESAMILAIVVLGGMGSHDRRRGRRAS